jgi:hypothetical protein
MRLFAPTLLALLASTSAEETYVHTALKNLVDATFSQSALTDAGKTDLATLLENCEFKSSPFTSVLDDAVDAVNRCSDSVRDKTNKLYLTTDDLARFKNCTFAARDVYTKYGGINFLAQPSISAADKDTLRRCSEGDDLAAAFGVVLNRYTPCELTITSTETAHFGDALDSSSRFVGENRKSALQQICNSLYNFESLNDVIARFTTSSVTSFLQSFTDTTERR